MARAAFAGGAALVTTTCMHTWAEQGGRCGQPYGLLLLPGREGCRAVSHYVFARTFPDVVRKAERVVRLASAEGVTA